jgi:CO/xanthine dehydrogenase FAD-binding subunit
VLKSQEVPRLSTFTHAHALLIGVDENHVSEYALPDVAKDGCHTALFFCLGGNFRPCPGGFGPKHQCPGAGLSTQTERKDRGISEAAPGPRSGFSVSPILLSWAMFAANLREDERRMKPFEYQAPASIAEAVDLLADRDRKAIPLAGGTDLLVQLRRGLSEPDLLVDIKRIPELNCVTFDPDAGLTVGAAVTCARLCEHPDARRLYPGLIDAASIIGGAAIQGRATLGGNLCNAAPSADTIPAMIVLNATCAIVGPAGSRTVPVSAFCTAPGKTVLGKAELLVSIRFPAPTPNSGACYRRFTPRREMDIAVAGVGVWVALRDDHASITDARIALSAVAPTPLLVEPASTALVGQAPTEAIFAEAAKLAQQAADPIDDVRGTRAQRHHLVGVLVKQALRGAVGRARGEKSYD